MFTLRVKLYSVIIAHFAIIIMNTLAFFALPMLACTNDVVWYKDFQVWTAWPLCTFIIFISFARGLECPITRLENSYRKELGMNEIRGFLKHYVIKPYLMVKRQLFGPKKKPAVLSAKKPERHEIMVDMAIQDLGLSRTSRCSRKGTPVGWSGEVKGDLQKTYQS